MTRVSLGAKVWDMKSKVAQEEVSPATGSSLRLEWEHDDENGPGASAMFATVYGTGVLDIGVNWQADHWICTVFGHENDVAHPIAPTLHRAGRAPDAVLAEAEARAFGQPRGRGGQSA